MRLPGFIGGTYQAQSSLVGAEECINLFPEIERVPGQEQPRVALYRDPGLRSFASVGVGPIRGFFSQDGRTFTASGAEFYEVFADGSTSRLGAIQSDNRPVSIASNGAGGHQLLITSGGKGYRFNLNTNVLTDISTIDSDFPSKVGSCGFIDGYGLVHVLDSTRFYISALEDFTSWDPTDVFQKSRTSDNVRAMVILLGQAWLFGSRTIEPWYDSGDALTPFQPVPDVLVPQGILSADAWTYIEQTIFWAGETEDGGRVVYRASGFQPQRVSTHALEAEWRTYGTTNDVTCWDYLHQGHPCVQFDFPSEGISWAYDTHTNLWHKRGYWNDRIGAYESHLGRCHVYAFDKHLVGSRVDGTIYEQAADAYDDAGTPQRWLRRAPAVHQELRNVVHGRFWVDAEVGTTPLFTGQGSEPRMMMRFSDSAAKKWSVERWRSIGVRGNYDQRTIWNKLGMARGPHGRIYEIAGTDPVPIALRDAGIDIAGRAA